nr:MAG TPA: hypothetical protein [Caudoviricetes sp.]
MVERFHGWIPSRQRNFPLTQSPPRTSTFLRKARMRNE